MSLSPSSAAGCPVPRCHCRRSITSPCVPLLSCTSIAPGVVFFIQLTRPRHSFTQSSFPDKLFRSCEEPVLFFFFYCLSAFFSYSGSGEARARAGSSARAARSPGQPSSGFVSFLTRAPSCWYRTSQGTKSWTCRASTQPCFSRMGCEAAGSTGTRDKGWGGFGRKVLSGFVKHEPGWRFG